MRTAGVRIRNWTSAVHIVISSKTADAPYILSVITLCEISFSAKKCSFILCAKRGFPRLQAISHSLHNLQDRNWRDGSQAGGGIWVRHRLPQGPTTLLCGKAGLKMQPCSQESASVTPNGLVPQPGLVFQITKLPAPLNWWYPCTNPRAGILPSAPSIPLRGHPKNTLVALPETLPAICSFWGNHPLTIHRSATGTLCLLYPGVSLHCFKFCIARHRRTPTTPLVCRCICLLRTLRKIIVMNLLTEILGINWKVVWCI